MSNKKENQKIERYENIMKICVNYNFKQTARIVTQFYDQMFKEAGIRSTQFSLLISVIICKDCTFEQLANFLNMDNTTLTRNIQALQKRELVSVSIGKDKRTKTVLLTPEGENVLEKAFPIWKKVQRHFLQGLGTEKWKSLKENMEILINLGKSNSL